MKSILFTGLFALASVLAVIPSSVAGPFEDGLAAYQRKDYAAALKFWRPLAEQGSATPQHNLGEMYRLGLGVPQSDRSAVKWYRKAAEQGMPDAQSSLGIMYGQGKGVRQDFVQAYMWLSLAEASGLKAARGNLEFCATHMTSKQITEAKRLAREWKAKHRR